jgi:hypothetical protein
MFLTCVVSSLSVVRSLLGRHWIIVVLSQAAAHDYSGGFPEQEPRVVNFCGLYSEPEKNESTARASP